MQALRLHGQLDDDVNFVRITKSTAWLDLHIADIVVQLLQLILSNLTPKNHYYCTSPSTHKIKILPFPQKQPIHHHLINNNTHINKNANVQTSLLSSQLDQDHRKLTISIGGDHHPTVTRIRS